MGHRENDKPKSARPAVTPPPQKAAPMVPELGQMCFGHCQQHVIDPHADALIMAILAEMRRIYWNVNQKEWNYENFIPGVETNPYDWGWDEDENSPPSPPNLSHNGVNIEWYKYPGRSMSVNKSMTVDEWATWFYSVLRVVRAYAKKHDGD